MVSRTVGIVGGGQLCRMLAQAAKGLGFNVAILETNKDCPAAEFADKQVLGSFTDAEKIKELAKISDFLTFEIESANAAALEQLKNEGKNIHPSPQTLSLIKNKFAQKQFLRKNGITLADFVEIKTRQDILKAAQTFSYPVLLKTKFDAYDGRGNALILNEQEIDAGMQKLQGKELYLEKFVEFERELAVVVARGAGGNVVSYPVFHTIHKNHICHTVIAPADVSDKTKQQAQNLAISAMKYLDGIGVFCIEMFLAKDGSVLVNEIAPRVHNAGHLTIEASLTSQFENHIRAITGMELGATELKTPYAVMVNILGQRDGKANFVGFDGNWEEFAAKYKLPSIEKDNSAKIFIHIYGKIQTKPERKMGHITVLANNVEMAAKTAEHIRQLIEI